MMRPRKDYGVRVIAAWDHFRVGQIIFPNALYRDALLRTKRVEIVGPPVRGRAAAAATVVKPVA